MITKLATISFLLSFYLTSSQTVNHVYKIDGLLNRLANEDTVYVLNFWAAWCKPCIQELPAFDSLYRSTRQLPVKIILVSLDFKEELQKKVNPFLTKNKIQAECVLLDELNGNDFINKISKAWSGAIPATYLKHKEKNILLEQKVTLHDLEKQIAELK